MSSADLSQELTETTVEDKLRRLVSFFSSLPFDQIDMSFELQRDADKVEAEYFNEMMAGAVTYHFKIETDPSTIGGMVILKDIADYIHCHEDY
ncbi:unnamed protein product [Caenorhabditis auriculariae]|uniref:Uncharacterized protein n=1 Tax=Caenorhabditis auriculariae TaxID=2777116 RepID=A0A8S1GWG9_9PELO|nr:unnamed protein product [Caenorhabditis auriculariae]